MSVTLSAPHHTWLSIYSRLKQKACFFFSGNHYQHLHLIHCINQSGQFLKKKKSKSSCTKYNNLYIYHFQQNDCQDSVYSEKASDDHHDHGHSQIYTNHADCCDPSTAKKKNTILKIKTLSKQKVWCLHLSDSNKPTKAEAKMCF